ncbi:hypothetical protein CYY_007186 [Polysphondylium violaceum]|uniref:Uncharacterized protein n=1 Tax=Polysphondylium violaceum TaxID=133409 RepID=A0A8J4UR21_9MYCE|nr:hypothetical protein CYY_007186 [Polysphondylium violaceum]
MYSYVQTPYSIRKHPTSNSISQSRSCAGRNIPKDLSDAITFIHSNQSTSMDELALIDEVDTWDDKKKDILYSLYFQVIGEITKKLKSIYNNDRLLAFIIKKYKEHYTSEAVGVLHAKTVFDGLIEYDRKIPTPILVQKPKTASIMELNEKFIKNYTASKWVACYQHLAFSEHMEGILLAKIDTAILSQYFFRNGVSIKTIFQNILLGEWSENVTLKVEKLSNLKWDPSACNLNTYLESFSSLHQYTFEIFDSKAYSKQFQRIDPISVMICRSGLPKVVEPKLKKLMNENHINTLAGFFKLCHDYEPKIVKWITEGYSGPINRDPVNNVVEKLSKAANHPTPTSYTRFYSERKRPRGHLKTVGRNQGFRKSGHTKPLFQTPTSTSTFK